MNHTVHIFIAAILFAAHLSWVLFMPVPINLIPTLAVGGWVIGARTYHISKWLAHYLQRRKVY
jgi:hypothetical protein